MSDESSRAPSRFSAGFYCPRCGVYSQQEWSGLVVEADGGDGQTWFQPLETEVLAQNQTYDLFEHAAGALDPWEQATATPPQWRDSQDWAVSRCLACQRGTVWHDNQIVFPAARTAPQPSPDMPGVPRELYEEAAAVMQVSRRAGAAMARATLERLLIELDPMDVPRPALDERIIHVIPRVSSALEPALTVIRHAGNKALHVADAPDDTLVLVLDEEDEGIVELLFSAINDLVDELVTKPNVRQRLLNTVPASVIEAVERKKAAAEAEDQAG